MSMDNLFLDEYIDQMSGILSKTNKDFNKEKIKSIVEETVRDRLRDPEVILDNNYVHKTSKTYLTSVFHYLMEKKPILAGNGTFYKHHSEARNPISEMVDGFLDTRAELKAKMFANGDENSHEYKDLDLKQGNQKKLANSYYGASGAPTSAFYSKWSGPATTLSAQQVISTTEQTFESFLTDNFIFIDFNECFTWLSCVLNEKDFVLDDWVQRVSFEDCLNRVYSKLLVQDEEKYEILKDYLKPLGEEEWTHIYYKNNLIEFTRRHKNVAQLHDKIFKDINRENYEEYPVDKKGNFINPEDFNKIPDKLKKKFEDSETPGKDWNKFVSVQKFYDPNKIPDSVKDTLNELNDIYMKYIYVKYMALDRIYRLRNFKRKVVTVIDTDSNILSLDTWMKFCMKELMTSDYGREEDDNIFIAINTITYVITSLVTNCLMNYGEYSNVEESHRGRYAMKNEFYFARLIIAKTKKRYLSKIILREGNRLTKPKYDIKGLTNMLQLDIIKRPSTKKLVFANRVNCWECLKLACL